jgi:plastocyanin
VRWFNVLFLISACTGPETIDVEIRDLVFHPFDRLVSVGDTVVWTNRDVVPHTVTFGDREGQDEVPPGGTWELIVPPGDTLRYRCRHHPLMTGRLVVR